VAEITDRESCLLGWVVLGVVERWLGEADTSMMDESPVDEAPMGAVGGGGGGGKLCGLGFCATDSLETM